MSHECCRPRPPGTLHSPHQAGLAVPSDPCINNKGARRSFVEDYCPVPLKQVHLVDSFSRTVQGPTQWPGQGISTVVEPTSLLLDVKVVVLLVLHPPG